VCVERGMTECVFTVAVWVARESVEVMVQAKIRHNLERMVQLARANHALFLCV